MTGAVAACFDGYADGHYSGTHRQHHIQNVELNLCLEFGMCGKVLIRLNDFFIWEKIAIDLIYFFCDLLRFFSRKSK